VKRNVLVTFPADGQLREVVTAGLGRTADPVFLEEIPANGRAQAFRAAEVLLSYLFGREVRPEELPLLKNLALLQSVTAGVEHLPFAQLPPGAMVCANAGAWADPIAEHALGLILALGKDLMKNHLDLARGDFGRPPESKRLRGGTCGIVGFGGIGRAAARLLRPLGMRILALNTSGRTEEEVDFIGTLADLERVLRASDVVLLSIPLTNRTRGLIGARELTWMKDEAILINVARGPIVQQRALYERLQAQPSFQAGIDVWWVEPGSHGEFRLEFPFFELDNFLGSPHNADHVPGMLQQAAAEAAANAARFLDGRPLKGLVQRSDYL